VPIQLHVVEEVINCMQLADTETNKNTASEPPQQLMQLSAVAIDVDNKSQKYMVLRVSVQGIPMLFLVDSGSSICFINQSKLALLFGKQQLPKQVLVQVASGEILQSTNFLPLLTWTADE
jgi:predicted aspartyl protease